MKSFPSLSSLCAVSVSASVLVCMCMHALVRVCDRAYVSCAYLTDTFHHQVHVRLRRKDICYCARNNHFKCTLIHTYTTHIHTHYAHLHSHSTPLSVMESLRMQSNNGGMCGVVTWRCLFQQEVDKLRRNDTACGKRECIQNARL